MSENFKAGDRVKVVSLVSNDSEFPELKVGCYGTVAKPFPQGLGGCFVRFDGINPPPGTETRDAGTWAMYNHQLAAATEKVDGFGVGDRVRVKFMCSADRIVSGLTVGSTGTVKYVHAQRAASISVILDGVTPPAEFHPLTEGDAWGFMSGQLELIAQAEFKIGDRVKITRKAASGENGWDNEWVTGMDDAIGKTGDITCISERTGVAIRVEGVSLEYYYPPHVLELVATTFKVGDTGLTRDGKSYEVISVTSKETYAEHPQPIKAKITWADGSENAGLNFTTGGFYYHPENPQELDLMPPTGNVNDAEPQAPAIPEFPFYVRTSEQGNEYKLSRGSFRTVTLTSVETGRVHNNHVSDQRMREFIKGGTWVVYTPEPEATPEPDHAAVYRAAAEAFKVACDDVVAAQDALSAASTRRNDALKNVEDAKAALLHSITRDIEDQELPF